MEVYALIGAAGTGKSHRASLVAAAYGISHIIDDGLLVVGARIVAGLSAKKEDSKMAAVRRAIFAERAHADDVRAALAADRPERVLILGTSRHMIELITDALDLPRPDKYITSARSPRPRRSGARGASAASRASTSSPRRPSR
jgi:hypothetical protein